MCQEALDACLLLSKFVPGWFVTNKMLKVLDNVAFSNDDTAFLIAYSDNNSEKWDHLGQILT